MKLIIFTVFLIPMLVLSVTDHPAAYHDKERRALELPNTTQGLGVKSNALKKTDGNVKEITTPDLFHSATPYGRLDASVDKLKITIGLFSSSMRLDQMPTGTPNFSSTAITGAVPSPAGIYNGDATWPDIGVGGYANVFGTGKSGVAVGGFAGVGVTGGFVEGFNGVVGNAPTGALSVDGQGFDFAHLYGNESDNNIWRLPSGRAPSGDVVAYLAFISGHVNSTGAQTAFAARQQGASKWGFAYTSDNGASAVFAIAGAQKAIGPADGQPILLKAIGGNGPIGKGGRDIIAGSLQGYSDGTLRLNALSAIRLDAATTVGSTIDIKDGIYNNHVKFASNTGGYNVIFDVAGDETQQLGASINYFNQDTTIFRSKKRSVTFANMSISGIIASVPIVAPSYTETLHTPRSSSEACAPGQFTDDTENHYVCTSRNHWRKVSLSDF